MPKMIKAMSWDDVMNELQAKQTEMQKNPPPPLTPEQEAQLQADLKELSGMGGFRAFGAKFNPTDEE